MVVIGLNIEEGKHKDIAILRLEGRLDAATVPKLEEKLSGLISKGHNKIIIDFSKVTYLSSAGMRLLLSASKKIRSLDGTLAFCMLGEEVMEIIKMAGFEKILSIFPTEREALNQF